MNKQKDAPVLPRRRFLRPFLWIALILACGYASILVLYQTIGAIQPSPDSALLPTAEYLYAHPQPTLDYVQVGSRTSEMNNRICYWSNQSEENAGKTQPQLGDFPWREIVLNGSRVPPTAIRTEILTNFTQLTQKDASLHLASCFSATDLSAGLHLVELQLKANFWDTPIIYQWAVMVAE